MITQDAANEAVQESEKPGGLGGKEEALAWRMSHENGPSGVLSHFCRSMRCAGFGLNSSVHCALGLGFSVGWFGVGLFFKQ